MAVTLAPLVLKFKTEKNSGRHLARLEGERAVTSKDTRDLKGDEPEWARPITIIGRETR